MATPLVSYAWEERRALLSTWDDRDVVAETGDHVVGYLGGDGTFVLVEVLKLPVPGAQVH